jgi:predicted transposase YbfD/YdcC
MIESERNIGDKCQTEQRFYVSSLPLDAKAIASAIRQHWHVENKLHWVLDVTFKEDSSRIRREYAAHNLAMMRHLTLNLIKKEPSKMSVPRKRRMAVLHDDFRHKCLQALKF